MKISSLINQVDIENLYQHVLNLEGIRHPIQAPSHLECSFNYIKTQFKEYGLKVNEQSIKLELFEQEFKNIEGILSKEKNEDIFLLTSHYDTVINCPGAIDNASAVAIILECARILSNNDVNVNIHFLGFTLEEFNASWVEKRFRKMRELGLMDEKNRYTSYFTSELMKTYKKISWKYRQQGISPGEAVKKSIKVLNNELSGAFREFLNYELKLYEPFSHSSIWGSYALIGSEKWVSEFYKSDKKIQGVINFDAIGFNSRGISQHALLNIDESDQNSDIPTLKNTNNSKNPNIQIFADKNSKELMDAFNQACNLPEIKINTLNIRKPYKFEYLAKNEPDVLRSDHTPFWKRDIPAIFVTDYAERPNPYYHTPADTIDKIDFQILRKITQATIALIYNFIKNK
ncbi:MAG: M28 family peptidase [archaeon]|nr:M28 family peptidase [archaeon]